MSDDMERDVQEVRAKLDGARRELLGVVTSLRDEDLAAGRRGGWPVRRVLEHVIHSEWLYSRLITHLRGLPVPGDPIEAMPSSAAQATALLEASHAALLAASEGVDEEPFYRLQQIGHEEYSILSLLENEASHEHEHTNQMREILAN